MSYTLYIVVPCYNEQEVLPISGSALLQKLTGFIESGRVTPDSGILFVNDGSKDETWNIIRSLHEADPHVHGISLAHNAGEQKAYLAGMFTAIQRADVVITTDCDLQDDINAMDGMLTEYENGCEIVYGVRNRREKETAVHKSNAGVFYKLMKACGSELPPEHSQYRLMSKRAVEMLADYGEVNLFLPALVPTIGLKSATVAHLRTGRAAGKTNYSVMKLIRLAIEAVTSFSAAPLLLITLFCVLCGLLTLVSLIAMIVVSVRAGAFNIPLCVLTAVFFIGTGLAGGMRILGEYLFKNYMESKHRPRYHIADSTDNKRGNN